MNLSFTSDLNDPQREAVLHSEGPLLVLAGAGSGKTRVLTYRIAQLVANCQVPPWHILAITFTNKAAGEMRERITAHLGDAVKGMWVMTYHAACVRILRSEAQVLGYNSNFSIYDDDDAKRLLKDIMRELDIDPQHFPLAGIRNRISQAKNQLQTAEDLPEFGTTPADRHTRAIYARYTQRLLAAQAMDFDDLLLNTARLFMQHPDVLARYQDRFRYLLVDEYQDTNHAQYIITKLLAEKHRNLMVVGDDDQSIYSWRGANVGNILEFERDYPEAHTIKLEQNYRSTGNILQAANALVAHNSTRKPKQLFTTADAGEPLQLYLASSEHDEARYIAAHIEYLARTEGRPHSDFALFYRTNAQSRVLEDALLRAGLGYRIVGGTRYFDRAEIRDIMAYLKVVVNPADDISLLRIINTPRRGIGSTSLQALQNLAARESLTLEAAVRRAIATADSEDSPLRAAATKALGSFVAMLDEMRSYQGELAVVVQSIITASGLLASFEAQSSEQAAGRAENIREFVNVAAEFQATHTESSLPDFMEWLALRTDLDSLSGESDTLTMMTVHSAKGLEYPVVFVAGLEEGLFPHAHASYDQASIEEERRLAYVAITRARERLILTRAASRMTFGAPARNAPSRFLAELPAELLHTQGLGSDGFEQHSSTRQEAREGVHAMTVPCYGGDLPQAKEVFAVGDSVNHKIWGKGTVVTVDGDSLSIDFVSKGNKNVMVGFAPIVKIR
ncbi:MAG: UvrD-helicase domain-containing protein [Coriobacteriia bacterium]|nr:UvrD-helicase domain-containing protein [Coriobacteriia bacterium]